VVAWLDWGGRPGIHHGCESASQQGPSASLRDTLLAQRHRPISALYIVAGQPFTLRPALQTPDTRAGSARTVMSDSGSASSTIASASKPATSCPERGACGPSVAGP